MARTHWMVAVTASCIALVATISLLRFFSWTTSTYLISHDRPQIVLSNGPNKDAGPSLIDGQSYLLGVGKADITGPVAEIEFMGYAEPDQLGTGVRQRLYTRAFIIGDLERTADRFVYLTLDTQSGDTAVRDGILNRLKELGPKYALYGQQNIAVTGTHSHSGPGAWLNYLLPQIPSKGFNKQSYEAIVEGSVRAIQLAHESLQAGTLQIGSITVPDANINRSPFSYLANPQEERNQYEDMTETDLTMLKLRAASDGKDIGILTWYATHGTSMHANNSLVTGDNKGVAAALFENYARSSSTASPGFVAGFSQSSVGDTSPNTLGAFCETGPQQGQLCDYKTSLCAGKALPCHARGHHWGLNDAGTASTYENGRRQYASARKLYETMVNKPNQFEYISSGQDALVKSMHVFVDFANRTFPSANGTMVRTCPAALGYSFAAGTSDGPGNRDFKQHNHGDADANPLWKVVRNSIHKPGQDQITCQGVKPILLDVGSTLKPYLWTPNIVDLQFFRVGNLFIIVSPGEATTMAGRRWKALVQSTAEATVMDSASQSGNSPHVVLGGPANSYTHYISTPEEYAIQRYEGASTLYGEHTLEGYLELTKKFIPYLSHLSATQANATTPPIHPDLPLLGPGPFPPINTNASYSFISPVIRDSPGFFKSYGTILSDVLPTYSLSDPSPPVIEASFIGANPRNNLRLGATFALVERYDSRRSTWLPFRSDADWSLVFSWERTSTALATSTASIRWELGWEIGVWGRDAPSPSPSAADRKKKQQDKPGQTGEKTELLSHRPRRKKRARDPLSVEGSKILGFEDDYLDRDELRGTYRLRYFGDAKSLSGRIEAFEGVSGEFRLV